MNIFSPAAMTAVATIALSASGGVLAQTAPLAASQVSGAELQAWVDADGLALGGIDLQGGCQFLAKNKGGERHLSVFCPGSPAPWTVKGEGKVVGDKWCVKFRFPDGNVSDQCEEFFKLGDNKYEIRLAGKPLNRVYRLVP
ncbi:MAG: hypothetical protein Q8R01_03650 [Ramlibacter sp.]|nr:hypothetical protein [Ramlibacter sp.]